MDGDLLYEESITSRRTEALFVLLTLLFSVLYMVRIKMGRRGKLSAVSLFFSIFFLSYLLNYRTLVIHLTSQALKLKFGLSSWVVPLDNIEHCQPDDIPLLMRMGGAGIHFMMIRKRYRASFNFLEYPRVVIKFKNKVGPVQDISFSTRQPDQLIRLIQEVVSANTVA